MQLKEKKEGYMGLVPALIKMKSLVNKEVSEAVITQILDIVFKEIERYNYFNKPDFKT